MTISNEGEVRILFSESLIIPPNLTVFDSETLQLELIPSGLVMDRYLNFDWVVTDFTEKYFVIQLEFENPLYVSSNGADYLERLKISPKSIDYFRSKTTSVPILDTTFQ